jgi:hypothetical protein
MFAYRASGVPAAHAQLEELLRFAREVDGAAGLEDDFSIVRTTA